jgi:hypothetical protein
MRPECTGEDVCLYYTSESFNPQLYIRLIQIKSVAKLNSGKRSPKTELTVISPLRRQRFPFDHSAISVQDEEEKE